MTTIPPAAVVVLVMLGASALVVCGYAIHRLMGFGDMPPDQHRSHEQDEYMREVRARNLTGLSREGRHAKKAFDKDKPFGPSVMNVHRTRREDAIL